MGNLSHSPLQAPLAILEQVSRQGASLHYCGDRGISESAPPEQNKQESRIRKEQAPCKVSESERANAKDHDQPIRKSIIRKTTIRKSIIRKSMHQKEHAKSDLLLHLDVRSRIAMLDEDLLVRILSQVPNICLECLSRGDLPSGLGSVQEEQFSRSTA